MSETFFSLFATSLILESLERIFLIASDTFVRSNSMQPLHILSTILYSTTSCDVKLLVAATPISGPQFSPMEIEDWCTSEDVIMLTIDMIFDPDFLAILTASNTSALSPLCDIAIRIDFSSNMSGENCASLEINGSIFIFAYFEKRNFAINAAL